MTPLDRVNQLINNVKNDISSGLYSLQSIFNKYNCEFKALKSLGINYITIYKKGDFELSEKHFMNLINRANHYGSKSTSSVEQIVNSEKILLSAETSQPQPELNTQAQTISPFSDADWKAIGIHNDHLISRLQETDLTPNEVKSWNCANQIQLSNRISEYRQRKMKRK
ncbi:hypothetical protein M5236_004420 [Vibrio parahaemolyticus]|nr:hypothetical protein [Vibrio parahaemolyticus]